AVSLCGIISRVVHQTDESVFQTGGDLPPIVRLMTERRDGAFQPRGVVTAHMQRGSKSHRLLHSRIFAKLLSQTWQIRASHRPCRQTDMLDDLIDRAVREQFSTRNVSQPVAALGFV